MDSRHLVTLTLLVAFMMPASAEQLYKWQEKDGSITFAPNPPPKGSGIEFTIVETDTQQITRASETQVASTTHTATTDAATSGTPTQAPSSDLPAPVQLAPALATARPAPSSTTQAPLRSAAAVKNNHCRELEKRVTSLIRVVRSGVTADVMDNAYIQMARYQKNHDRHCSPVSG